MEDLERRFEATLAGFKTIESVQGAQGSQHSRDNLSNDALVHVKKFHAFMQATFDHLKRRFDYAEKEILKFYNRNYDQLPTSETEESVHLAAFRAILGPSKALSANVNAIPLTHDQCVKTEIDRLSALVKKQPIAAKAYQRNRYPDSNRGNRNKGPRFPAIAPARGGRGSDARDGGRSGGGRNQGQGTRQRANARSEIAANPRVTEEGHHSRPRRNQRRSLRPGVIG